MSNASSLPDNSSWWGSRSQHQRIWAIAAPAILANSSAPLVGLVDTWAVGHLPGAVHLAAVGLGSVIFNYLLWGFGFLRMGTTGLVAQQDGRADSVERNRTILRSLLLALAIGVLLLLLQQPLLRVALYLFAPPGEVGDITAEYFRIRIWATPAALLVATLSGVLFGLARTREVLVQQLLLNLANAAFNLWFVVGMGLGVPGVAWGTLLAQWLAAIASLWLVLRVVGTASILLQLRHAATWTWQAFRQLFAINGFIFARTLLLMTALAMIMRESAGLGDEEMAASHVLNQYMMLIALGLDGFAHAAEALAGNAWGERRVQRFRSWCRLTSLWALAASIAYALLFALAGDAITASLTDLPRVREICAGLMPLVVLLPLVSVACFQFDGIFIGATAGAAMLGTMAVAFVAYLLVLPQLTGHYGLWGLWLAVLVFMAARGLAQAACYPGLLRKLQASAG